MLSNGDLAIGAFNFSDKKRTITLNLFDIGIATSSGKKLELYDCVTQQDCGCASEILVDTIEPHDCRLYRAKLVDR